MLRSLWAALALALATLIAPADTAFANDRMVWIFNEMSDPANQGRMTATLHFGVPETDDMQVSGTCDATRGSSAKFSSLTFGADVGNLENGKAVDLRFSGGGTEQTLKGTVHRAAAEADINGVVVSLEHGDPLWQLLAEKDHLDYQVPGYRAVPLALKKGQENIGKFVAACKKYAEVLVPSNGTAAAPAAAGSAEKAAFDAAKDLGTREAWNAFLHNYPSGFHADLARAYLVKLEAPAGVAPQTAIPAVPQGAAETVLVEGTEARISCKQLFKVRSINSGVPSKLTFINRANTMRSIQWLDEKSQPKDLASLQSGQKEEFNTVTTHPWMIATGPGDCIEILYPGPNGTIVELTDASKSSTESSSRSKSSSTKSSKKKKYEVHPSVSCRELGLDYRNGQCVAKAKKDKDRYKVQKKKGCPAGTYLNPLGQCQPNETGG